MRLKIGKYYILNSKGKEQLFKHTGISKFYGHLFNNNKGIKLIFKKKMNKDLYLKFEGMSIHWQMNATWFDEANIHRNINAWK